MLIRPSVNLELVLTPEVFSEALQFRSKLLKLNIQFICQTLFIVYDHRGSDREREQ